LLFILKILKLVIRERTSCLRHCVQNSSGVHAASYLRGIGGYFPGGKAAGAYNWPVTSI